MYGDEEDDSQTGVCSESTMIVTMDLLCDHSAGLHNKIRV